MPQACSASRALGLRSTSSIRIVAGMTIAASLVAPTVASPAGAALLSPSGQITISAQLPHVDRPLPLYKLSRTGAPVAFVAAALSAAKGPALALDRGVFKARDARGVLRAYADPSRGEAEIFPDLTSAGGPPSRPQDSVHAAASIFARLDIIPRDATTIQIGAETPVSATEATHPAKGEAPSHAAPAQLFTYVSAMRRASGLPVYGKGSQATVAVDAHGSVRGLVRRWQAAQPAGTVTPTTTTAELAQAIRAQLQPYQGRYAITVENVAPAYYDGDAQFLQPVYFFIAGLRSLDNKAIAEHVVGYVPVGKLVEPIPSLSRPSPQPAPSTPRAGGAMPDSSQISLGEYANDDGQLLDQGNALINGLDSVPAWWYGPPIARTQYYWAHSWMYVGSYARYYMNSVQVAHTPPHGDWFINTTNSNCCDPFYINNIGTGGNPGYGSAAGGQLVTWIIDSCEVAPSYYDLQITTGNGYNAFNNWWPVFQGLHRVLAYRTQMLLHQSNFDYYFGRDAALGADIASAWYNDNASNYAQFNGYTYLDTHLNMYVHYGRVSNFVDTRNGGESIYNVNPQSASGQLNNAWMWN
jgi:hypothetical protein